MRKKCFGVGVCDVPYNVQIEETPRRDKRKVVWRCPYYQMWMAMLRRCYSDTQQKRSPTYIGCYVVPSWHKLSNFKQWVDDKNKITQNGTKLHLDKDILVPKNKVYGPDTCCLVPQYLNSAVIIKSDDSKRYPLGVFYKKDNNKFCSQIVLNGRKKHLGLFDDPVSAHRIWQTAKIKNLKELKCRYEKEVFSDNTVSKRLEEIITKIEQDLLNNVETVSLLS